MAEFDRRQYYRRKSKIVKMRRKIAFAKRRIRRFRMLLRVSIIAFLLWFSWWVLGLSMWYLSPDDIMKMNPEVVKIEGNIITPEYKISDIIRRQEIENEQIFKYSTKELEDELSKLQSVKKAYIRRFWFPARLIVFIEEKTPVFSIAPNNDTPVISAIASDGSFINREYMPLPSKFKTTKILSYGSDLDDYEKWDKKRVDEILKFIKTIETYSKQKIQYIDLRNQSDIYVQLEDVQLRLGAFDTTINDRIKWIPTILPEAKTLTKKVKYIDLRWNNSHYIKLDQGSKESPADSN